MRVVVQVAAIFTQFWLRLRNTGPVPAECRIHIIEHERSENYLNLAIFVSSKRPHVPLSFDISFISLLALVREISAKGSASCCPTASYFYAILASSALYRSCPCTV